MKYYCPKCGSEIEVIQGCGSVGYFCDNCKNLISSKNVVKKQDKDQ